MQDTITYIIIGLAVLASVYLFVRRWFIKSPKDDSKTKDCTSCDDGCANCKGCDMRK